MIALNWGRKSIFKSSCGSCLWDVSWGTQLMLLVSWVAITSLTSSPQGSTISCFTQKLARLRSGSYIPLTWTLPCLMWMIWKWCCLKPQQCIKTTMEGLEEIEIHVQKGKTENVRTQEDIYHLHFWKLIDLRLNEIRIFTLPQWSCSLTLFN